MFNSFESKDNLDVPDISIEIWRVAQENGADAITIRKDALILLKNRAAENIPEDNELAMTFIELVTHSMSFNCEDVATIPVRTLGQLLLFAEEVKYQELG